MLILDYVYVCRPGDNEELRYSIRSTVKNLPPGNIWVVGGKPDWYTGNFIEVPQNAGNPHHNVRTQLKAMLGHSEIGEDIVLMNDDFFTLKKIKTIPYLHCGSIQETLEFYADAGSKNLGYHRLIAYSKKGLRLLGVPVPLDYELHVPMPMKKSKLAEVIDFKNILWRSAYGNIHNVGGERQDDVKVYNPKKLVTRIGEVDPNDLTFISTHDSTFNVVYNSVLKDMFDKPTKYEKNP
jgi:hypothetical protein